MKLLIGILLYLSALMFLACKIEKEIQVKPIALTLVYIKESNRDARGILYWSKWIDEYKTAYSMYCFCPNYKIGDKQIFLITR